MLRLSPGTRRHLPLAKDLVRLSRQQLVHRLDSYMGKRNLPIFMEVRLQTLPETRSDLRLLSSETTAKGTGLEETAGKEDPVELDSWLKIPVTSTRPCCLQCHSSTC